MTSAQKMRKAKPGPMIYENIENTANKNTSKTKFKAMPFISPTESEGPPVPSPRAVSSVAESLQGRRRSLTSEGSFNGNVPVGFPEHHNMCYRNAALTMLLNIPAFVALLEHISIERQRHRIREDIEQSVGNNGLLTILSGMAAAYWSTGSDDERRERVNEVISQLWAYLQPSGRTGNVNHQAPAVPWGPFLDAEQREEQQDAGDFLENILTNGEAELQKPSQEHRDYLAMIEATFQTRTTCAGNCSNKRTRRGKLDSERLWTVNIDRSKGKLKGTLEDSIRTTLRNEIDLTCEKCEKAKKKKSTGHIWQRLRDAPEILLIRISRFEWCKKTGILHKLENRATVPATLDMTTFLEESDQRAGVQARYRLCGTVNHAGTMDDGHYVSHVCGPGQQWYRLEDQYVTPSSMEILNKDPSKFQKYKFTPYLLAYSRTDKEVSGVTTPPPTSNPSAYPTPSSLLQSKKLVGPTEPSLNLVLNSSGRLISMTHKLNTPTYTFDTTTAHPLKIDKDIHYANGSQLLRTTETLPTFHLAPVKDSIPNVVDVPRVSNATGSAKRPRDESDAEVVGRANKKIRNTVVVVSLVDDDDDDDENEVDREKSSTTVITTTPITPITTLAAITPTTTAPTTKPGPTPTGDRPRKPWRRDGKGYQTGNKDEKANGNGRKSSDEAVAGAVVAVVDLDSDSDSDADSDCQIVGVSSLDLVG